jgi:DNA replication protein DnaC
VTVPPGSGKSHLAQAIGFAVIQQGYRVLYREAHILLEDLAEAQLAGTRKDYVATVTTVPLLIIDALGMRKLPHTAAEDLLEIVMRRYERASTLRIQASAYGPPSRTEDHVGEE